MEKLTMVLFARTPVHVGAGNSVGAVDSPIQRERHTRIPIIPGSSLKGVFSDLWNEKLEDGTWARNKAGEELFGRGSDTNPRAGSLLIGEARVLAFPVRSAKGMFAWITCPMVLNRFGRDVDRSIDFDEESISGGDCLAGSDICYDNGKVVLEEYVVNRKGNADDVAAVLKRYMAMNVLWQSLERHLVILNDTHFSYFVENACEVVTRIRVDDETGTAASRGLFNQEQVPSETMFCSVIAVNDTKNESVGVLAEFKNGLEKAGNIVQVGGDETIGLGFCDVEVQ